MISSWYYAMCYGYLLSNANYLYVSLLQGKARYFNCISCVMLLTHFKLFNEHSWKHYFSWWWVKQTNCRKSVHSHTEKTPCLKPSWLKKIKRSNMKKSSQLYLKGFSSAGKCCYFWTVYFLSRVISVTMLCRSFRKAVSKSEDICF